MRLDDKSRGPNTTEVAFPAPSRDGLGAALRTAFRIGKAVPDELNARLDKIKSKGPRWR